LFCELLIKKCYVSSIFQLRDDLLGMKHKFLIPVLPNLGIQYNFSARAVARGAGSICTYVA
jgi:hypothetical protein